MWLWCAWRLVLSKNNQLSLVPHSLDVDFLICDYLFALGKRIIVFIKIQNSIDKSTQRVQIIIWPTKPNFCVPMTNFLKGHDSGFMLSYNRYSSQFLAGYFRFVWCLGDSLLLYTYVRRVVLTNLIGIHLSLLRCAAKGGSI